MLNCVCPDGRVRGVHLYYGARTGRWSGKIIQPATEWVIKQHPGRDLDFGGREIGVKKLTLKRGDLFLPLSELPAVLTHNLSYE